MPDLPPIEPYVAAPHVIEHCIAKASKARGIPEPVLYALYQIEGGKVHSQNLNDNGSFDMGPFQINTINLELVRNEFGDVSRSEIAGDVCLNAEAAAFLVARHLERRKGYLYAAIGDYHSKTPEVRVLYQRKFLEVYPKLLFELANQEKAVNYANYGFSGYLQPVAAR